ncbi:MAG: hypothetical protein A2W93_10305 [Bacteroidetes bacterium GWF2_43_63]|nr:MAG: hypothetical protein A2W94_02165 [Bacteroidetes bacterium GWE2_42_42]OFY52913.1 MAG: hypothetical protein A2W93_10305 [Bacteroidetes bacterium GWF2_43_63]HBG70120.1 hypothetical protein [Bacteroidales bacterium]HCB62273.1 hypothetical protein [Bacteroidales bacterium]
MQNFKRLNTLIGWAVFAIAAVVYTLTAEPTASFWDCGEYIATSFKLQVGHPPGAPTFQLLGRFFSMFAFGDVSQVAFMINMMSVLSSAFTILFLFWTITHFAKKLVGGSVNTASQLWTIIGAGIVGALAYTFSDSFWFSAVEGEVYAMSSMFTALVFWLMLKWEEDADDPRAFRWIILITFLMGLSIGVHLLNLLTLPALVMIYYYRRYEVSKKGVVYALLLSLVLLAIMFYVLIPGMVWLAGHFELFFINSIGLPFNSGTLIFFAVIIGLIVWGLRWSKRKGRVVLNTIVLSFAFLMIGYSTFFLLIIRSNANTPINENAPRDAISLLSYLNREQYGETPLITGHYFNAPLNQSKDWKDASPVYEKDLEKGKYIVTDERANSRPTYNKKYTTFLPRMWSSQENHHISTYLEWGGISEKEVYKNVPTSSRGDKIYTQGTPKNPPTFSQNMRFFFTYQVGHMYFRYFFWNFVGRQNDMQGHGSPTEGNWRCGIPVIDKMHLGNQDMVPEHMSKNPGNNSFYFLPLILGLVGLFFHLNKHSKDTLVVTLLFLMTGLAIVVYLNQYPYQPRERDYAYAGSFYAFAIWIGLGVVGLVQLLKKLFKESILAPIAATLIALLLVPGIMASEGWDDHNRSDRYTARDFAKNYLASCAPNSILFTNGDNDTFPLWYVQEVEGYRTDVRVVNLSLFNTDWYADQMKRKAYDSDPVPISMNHIQYRQGTRDIVYLLQDEAMGHVNIKELFDIMHANPEKLQQKVREYTLDFFPSRKFYLPVDTNKVVQNGTVPAAWKDDVTDSLNWTINKNVIQKNTLFCLDILAHFNWDRPIYFAITTGDDAYMGMEDYFSLEGLVYKLVPVKTVNADGSTGRVNTAAMYDNMMNKFAWGNLTGEGVYLDETNLRMCMNFRNNFARLAMALLDEGEKADSTFDADKKKKAVAVLDRCMEVLPESAVPYNYFVLPVAEAYYRAGEMGKANAIVSRLIDLYDAELAYYFSLDNRRGELVNFDKQQSLYVLQRIMILTEGLKQDAIFKKAEPVFGKYYSLFTGAPYNAPKAVTE